MKTKNYYYLLIAILVSSCSEMASEFEAIRINDRGLVELNNGKHEEAINLFRQALDSKSISTDTRSNIYRNIAQVYMEMQVQDSAIHYATLAATSFPKNTYHYLVNMADVHILNGEANLALKALNKAFKMNPNDLAVNNSLGLIYLGEYDYDQRDLEKALRFNKKAFEINQDRTTEYVLAKNYFEVGKFIESERHFENLYTHYPELTDHIVLLGMSKYRLKKTEEAEELWKEAVAIDSTYRWIIENFKESTEDLLY